MSGFKGFDDDDFGDFGDFGGFDSAGDDFGGFDTGSGNKDIGNSKSEESYPEKRTPFIENPEELKSHKKTAFGVIGLGIVVTLVALVVMGMLNKEPKDNSKVIEKIDKPVEEPVSTPVKVSNDWENVEYTQIGNFVSVDSIFTVTGSKHYVKVLSDETLVMKTVATGSLSGFEGTYTIEVPYRELKVGDNFPLQVKVGEYKGKTVISY